MVVSKYPKKCPRCGSTRLSKNESYGMKCNRCGYVARRKINKEEIKFVKFTGVDE